MLLDAPAAFQQQHTSNLQAGSVWAYVHHVFRDIKIFYNLDLASEPALQQVLKDLDQEIAAESGTKFPILRRQVVELYQKAMRDASPCDSDFHWAAEFLLIYLAILRFCEAGYTTASQVNTTRLLSWGTSLCFFRLKKRYRWCLIPRHLQNHRETTRELKTVCRVQPHKHLTQTHTQEFLNSLRLCNKQLKNS